MRKSLLAIVLCLPVGMALAQTGATITGEVKGSNRGDGPECTGHRNQ